MSSFYCSGCSLRKYNPELPARMESILKHFDSSITVLKECCRIYSTEEKPFIINTCPGCDYRFNQKGFDTMMLWEYLADKNMKLPDYHGLQVSIHDSCSIRGKHNIYEAVRLMLTRMNISNREPEKYTRENSRCCGASLAGKLPREDVLAKKNKRVAELPADVLVVYCAGCMNSLKDKGKPVYHMIDLLLGVRIEAGITG